MRKLFTIFALCALALVGCETPDSPDTPNTPVTPEVEFNLTGKTVFEFNADGGNDTISYELKNYEGDLSVTATSSEAWVGEFTYEANAINFVVSANETTETRSAQIDVTFDQTTYSVTVNQAAGEAPYVPQNIDINMTEATYTLPEEGDDAPANIFTVAFTNEAQSSITLDFVGLEGQTYINQGTYSIADGSLADGAVLTITESETTFDIKDGSVVVTIDGDEYTMDMNFVSTLDDTIHIAYTGEILNMDPTPDPAPNPEYALDIKLDYLNGTYYGSYEGSAAYNYYIYLSSNGLLKEDKFIGDGHVYRLDLYSSVAGEGDPVVLPEGTYIVDSKSSGDAGTCTYDYSFYAPLKDGYPDGQMCGIESGAIKVTANRIEAELKLYGGGIHHVVYEGSLELGFESAN